MKRELTIELLKHVAKEFCERESKYMNKDLYGVTDGKKVGTHIEHKFQNYLNSRYEVEIGSTAKGIDLPSEHPRYQFTFWHNSLFNPSIPDNISILSFNPDWSKAQSEKLS